MESDLIAIGLVMLIVGAVLLVAVGTAPAPLDLQVEAARLGWQAHALVSRAALILPW